MINKTRLLNMAKDYNMDISHCIDKLDLYAEILVEYNQKVNLTAITDDEGIEQKHFLDSLLFANNKLVKGKVIDVGTGAGFPGVVTKLYKPEIELTLLEPTGKRVDFLKYLCEKLEIDAIFVKERAEEAARKIYREKYDIAVARAVSELNILAEYCIPLVKPKGYFFALKADVNKEIENSKNALNVLNSKIVNINEFTLPNGSKRNILEIVKNKKNMDIYPRNGGVIKKKPL